MSKRLLWTCRRSLFHNVRPCCRTQQPRKIILRSFADDSQPPPPIPSQQQQRQPQQEEPLEVPTPAPPAQAQIKEQTSKDDLTKGNGQPPLTSEVPSPSPLPTPQPPPSSTSSPADIAPIPSELADPPQRPARLETDSSQLNVKKDEVPLQPPMDPKILEAAARKANSTTTDEETIVTGTKSTKGTSERSTMRERRNERKQNPPKEKRRSNLSKRIETMPYQCYQLALQIIKEDKEEKLLQIEQERTRIRGLKKRYGYTDDDKPIQSIREHIEKLHVLAHINDPRIKYRFENGRYVLNSPVFRYLADKKWRKMARPILMQRLKTMNVVPDILPTIDPVVEVKVGFKGHDKSPGAILQSTDTEKYPSVRVTPFKPGKILCTIAVVDPDVPDLKTNTFGYRLHWLVSNIEISSTEHLAVGGRPKIGSTTYSSWLPPHVQMGSPYHRYCLFILKQEGPIKLDVASSEELERPQTEEVQRDASGHALRKKMVELKRDGFNLRSFVGKHKCEPIGAFLWRGIWDEGTLDLMKRHNLPGWDYRFERNKP